MRCPSSGPGSDDRLRQPRPQRDRQVCRRTIWLDRGSVRADGPTVEVLDAYLKTGLSHSHDASAGPHATGPATLLGARLVDETGELLRMARRDQPLRVRVRLAVREPLSRLDLAIYMVNHRGEKALDESFSDTGELCMVGRPGTWE